MLCTHVNVLISALSNVRDVDAVSGGTSYVVYTFCSQ